MTTHTLDITGMTCAACSARVEKTLGRVPGVTKANVNLALERASVEAAPGVSIEMLIGAVDRAGYGARLRRDDRAAQRLADERRDAERRADERQTLVRLVVSALLTIPLVIGMLPMMTGAGHAWIGPWTQTFLATGVMAVAAPHFVREAVAALRGGSANMAVLVVLGTGVAYLYSLVLVLLGETHAHLHYEAAAVILTLITAGKYLEARAKRSTSAALTALGRLAPREAERVGASGTEIVAADSLEPGERVRVRPGAIIPCDGRILSGRSSIDEALVTGESLPVDRKPGDAVTTGTVNGEAALDIEVTAVGADTRLARMTRLVEDAQIGQAPIQKLVDRISAIFVPTILAVAALTFLCWWLIGGDAVAGMVSAVAVLVIACPCALGLATPTALVAGTGAAARAGILIRDIETLERADAIRTVAFDKTGTLTLGEPELVEIAVAEGSETQLLQLAAAVEAQSEHPLAKALMQRAGPDVPSAVETRALAGRGLAGLVGNRRVAIGNAMLAIEEGADRTAIDALSSSLTAQGTTSFVTIDGRLAGAFVFADRPRPEAAGVVSDLEARGLAVVMLTGDNEAAAKAVASETGIADHRAGLTPEDKIAAVREIGAVSDVAFVGDGLNDGPALAAARLGIALSSGTQVAREAAAITLMRPDLRLVPAALDIAQRTKRTIRQNLVWAFVYNVVGIPLAALGILSPVFAGAAMALSSVSVVTNSTLLARWKPELDAARRNVK
ncbi:cation-translocating P-type ATPase [Aliihoeflea sp. 40Bstr573]|uniref:heavy metal translocating P-type ATPase n=1 Tax=Aliihoeflea sp. 40Bstr573 TaxID=2696467 RepID=UPI002095F50B|nr:heavy metal translocating P-type ATPase [Aliihoeflea sp. 40Bstr573]MCO6387750.1 heavy metal translocating P-type ATPase [Aliihoeflea sp. 40Bstr573]